MANLDATYRIRAMNGLVLCSYGMAAVRLDVVTRPS